jgi:hypothetical protein
MYFTKNIFISVFAWSVVDCGFKHQSDQASVWSSDTMNTDKLYRIEYTSSDVAIYLGHNFSGDRYWLQS